MLRAGASASFAGESPLQDRFKGAYNLAPLDDSSYTNAWSAARQECTGSPGNHHNSHHVGGHRRLQVLLAGTQQDDALQQTDGFISINTGLGEGTRRFDLLSRDTIMIVMGLQSA
jgi:hypothetical protein